MKRRWRPLVLLFLGMGGCTIFPRTASEDRALPRDALRQSQAMAHFTHGLLLESGPKRDPDQALVHFRQAAELDPTAPGTLAALLRNLRARELHDEALEVLRRVARHLPEDFRVWWELAAQAEIMTNFTVAADAYATAARLAPEPQNLEAALGEIRVLFAAQRDPDALRTLRALRRRQDSDTLRGVLLQWAQYFVHHDQAERALPCLAMALRFSSPGPERRALQYMTAEIQLQAGHRRAAVRTYQRLLRDEPFQVGLALRLAQARFGDDPEDMREGLAADQRRNPGNIPTTLALAFLDHDDGDAAAAAGRLEHLRFALQQRGVLPDLDFFAFHGAVLVDANRADEAESVLKEGIERFPDDPTLRNNLAYLWAEQDVNLDTALDHARHAVAASPANGAFLDTLGWVYFRLQRLDDALNTMLRAVTMLPDDPVVLDHTGDVLAAMGRIPEALAYWHRSHAIDPEKTEADVKLRHHGATPQTPTQSP